MGSKSFLHLNQSKSGSGHNASSDDLASITSADSHSSRRFSDSIKGMGRRRGKSVSKEAATSRSHSSQSSSEAYAGRMVQSETLSGHGPSRGSIESGRSSVSITSPDPAARSSDVDSFEAPAQPAAESQDPYSSAPRRLTGWLYNMVGSDNTPSSMEAGAPLSPVREADVLDFPDSSPTPDRQASRDALHSVSPQKAVTRPVSDAGSPVTAPASAPMRTKAGALFQTLAHAGSTRGVKTTAASAGENAPSGPAASNGNVGTSSAGGGPNQSAGGDGSGGGNNGSWVPGGVGLDRAFKFFMDGDGGNKNEEGIWLLGVWHGPRETILATSLGAADATSEASALPANASEMSRESEDDVAERTRAASPTSSISASSPRRTPADLIHTSLASSSSAHASGREASRVGSSVSTAATTSTSDSLRTKSSATSFHAAPSTSTSVSVDPQAAFQPDFASRIWCTYRNHFAPISRDGVISEQAASAAEALAAAQLAAAPTLSAPSTPSDAPSSEAAQASSPPASAGRGWLGRKMTESTAAQEAALQGNAPLGLGAALGAGYATASTSLGEKMGISNLWSRATAAAQAAGFSRAGLTTDSGWGCMLRTGQSLLANALVNVHLGRAWQREPTPMRQLAFLEELAQLSIDAGAEKDRISAWREKRARHATYVKILSWFLDDPSPACPFGVHRMAREGKRLGKEVGEWFGPSTAAGAIKQLVSEFPEAGIAVELAHDGVFYLDEVRAAAGASVPATSSQQLAKARSATADPTGHKGDSVPWQRPVLILIGLRLGLDSVNPIYYESVKATFSFPHSVGIAGGRPSSSYYFMGHQGNSLFYLDPHNVRPAVPLRYPPRTFPAAVPRQLDVAHRFALDDQDDEDEWWSHAYTEAQTSTFHCEKVRRMPIKSLDPSMLLGFLVKDEEHLVDLCARIKALPKTIFSFAESAPKWVDDDDFDPSMESFSEPSVGEESDDEAEKSKEGDEAARVNVLSTDDDGEPLRRAKGSAGVENAAVPFPSDAESGTSDTLFRESQQRTAAWLGHGPAPSNVTRAAYSNGGGIAFPSLDLLSPPSEGHTLQRPSRSDARQVSTSSAATTRPARRETNSTTPAEPAKGRDLTASQAAGIRRAEKTSPPRSPGRLGPDDSFSTVHLSDSEMGSAWEEVSDGGTIAPSGSAGPALLRTGSPLRAHMATEPALSADPDAEKVERMLEPSPEAGAAAFDVPISPISAISEGDLVSLSLDTPVAEAPRLQQDHGSATAKDSPVVAFPGSAKAEGEGSYFGLTSAHEPLALPRRRSHSRPSPVDLASASAQDAPPVPAIPAVFHQEGAGGGAANKAARKSGAPEPHLDGSDDDF